MIQPFKSDSMGTLSVLSFFHEDGQFNCLTLELPWKMNRRNVSCIPFDMGADIKGRSNKFPIITPVRGRSGIQLEIGNFIDEIKGCILVGDAISFNGQRYFLQNSRGTFTSLNRLLTRDYTNLLFKYKFVKCAIVDMLLDVKVNDTIRLQEERPVILKMPM